MRRRCVMVIRRDDHKRDALGAIFLGAVKDDAGVRALVERYVGPSIKVVEIERRDEVIRVDLEATVFAEESQNLVSLARSMVEKGRLRAATDTLGEALRLDPLNAEALRIEAAARALRGDGAGAESRWIFSAELTGFHGETLRGLAQVALEQDRRPTAMRYLEEALEVDPHDEEARRILDQLRRQIELRFEDPKERS